MEKPPSGEEADMTNTSIIETDPAKLQEIYKTSCDLFQTQKITPQNAFSIKLLECIQEILQLDTFHNKNMHEFGRVLEIGGKIYICRVDSTHTDVLKLASEITSRSKRKVPVIAGEGEEAADATGTHERDTFQEQQNAQRKKKPARKKGRHLRSEESLQMDFNCTRRVQDRREAIEELFDDWIYNYEDFDYAEYLHRYQKRSEAEINMPVSKEAAENKVNFSLHVVNDDEMQVIIFYPFHFVNAGVWNSSAFDLWGRLLPGFDPSEFNLTQRPGSRGHHFEYLSQRNQMAEHDEVHAFTPDNVLGVDNDIGAGDGYPGGGSILDDNGEIRPLDINKLTSLDQLGDYFNALKKLHLVKKDQYCWIGPTFIQNKRRVPATRVKGRPKKQKKEPEVVDFLNVDWKDRKNRFTLVAPEKTQISEEEYASWTNQRTTIPYWRDLQRMNDDEREFDEPFDKLDENGENYVDPLLRYFVDPNRNLLGIVATLKRAQATHVEGEDNVDEFQQQFEELPEIEGEREFQMEHDNIHKDQHGNFPCSEADARSMNLYSNALKSFVHCFPNPIPGQPNPFEDPLNVAYSSSGLKYATQPKPINIKYLKDKVVDILARELKFDVTEGPLMDDVTSIRLVDFLELLLDELDERTKLFLTLSIIMVALLHVVVEKKFFMEAEHGDGKIICKGKNWRHEDNIPGMMGIGDGSLEVHSKTTMP